MHFIMQTFGTCVLHYGFSSHLFMWYPYAASIYIYIYDTETCGYIQSLSFS